MSSNSNNSNEAQNRQLMKQIADLAGQINRAKASSSSQKQSSGYSVYKPGYAKPGGYSSSGGYSSPTGYSTPGGYNKSYSRPQHSQTPPPLSSASYYARNGYPYQNQYPNAYQNQYSSQYQNQYQNPYQKPYKSYGSVNQVYTNPNVANATPGTNPITTTTTNPNTNITTSTSSPNLSTLIRPKDEYIKTKTGTLVRVGSDSKSSSSSNLTTQSNNTNTVTTSSTSDASSSSSSSNVVIKKDGPKVKVNNRNILLNPRIMPYCPQFTLTGKCNPYNNPYFNNSYSGSFNNSSCPYARHDCTHLALCKQFLMRNGKCKKGNRCLLSHEPSEYNLPTCVYFLDGECSCEYGKGENAKGNEDGKKECRFAHPANLAPSKSLNKDGKIVHGEHKLCREFAYTGFCTLGASKCVYVHSYNCPEFVETGKCTEHKCRLVHVNDGKNRSINSSENKLEVKKERTKREEEVDLKELARSMYQNESDEENEEIEMTKEDANEEESGNEEEEDDSDDEEFQEFWKRRNRSGSSVGREGGKEDGFSKNDDFITF